MVGKRFCVFPSHSGVSSTVVRQRRISLRLRLSSSRHVHGLRFKKRLQPEALRWLYRKRSPATFGRAQPRDERLVEAKPAVSSSLYRGVLRKDRGSQTREVPTIWTRTTIPRYNPDRTHTRSGVAKRAESTSRLNCFSLRGTRRVERCPERSRGTATPRKSRFLTRRVAPPSHIRE